MNVNIFRFFTVEDRMFKQVDGWYFEFMLNVARLPNCMECGTRHGISDKMIEHVNTLDKVQKALEEFLETKRQIFPRFYFLSNDELLEILGQSKNARAVQPHMRKCFDAITGLEFGDQASGAIDIFAMISPQGEKVQLTKNLKARGPVEEWLLEVQQSMKKSLHDLFKQGNTKAKWSEYRVMESTVVSISITPPSFKPISLSLSRSPLF